MLLLLLYIIIFLSYTCLSYDKEVYNNVVVCEKRVKKRNKLYFSTGFQTLLHFTTVYTIF